VVQSTRRTHKVLAFRLTRRSGKRARLAKPAVRRKQDPASPAVLTELPEFWLKYGGCRCDYVQNCLKFRNKAKKIYLLYFNKIYIRVMKKNKKQKVLLPAHSFNFIIFVFFSGSFMLFSSLMSSWKFFLLLRSQFSLVYVSIWFIA
jgi:hypothetical protein